MSLWNTVRYKLGLAENWYTEMSWVHLRIKVAYLSTLSKCTQLHSTTATAVSSETQTATCFCAVTSSVRYGIIRCKWNETKLKLLTGPLPLLPRRAVGGVSALFGTLLPGTVEHSCRPLASKLRLEVPPLAVWHRCHVAPTPWRARSFPGASLLLTVSRFLFSGGLAAVYGAVHGGFKCPRMYKTM